MSLARTHLWTHTQWVSDTDGRLRASEHQSKAVAAAAAAAAKGQGGRGKKGQVAPPPHATSRGLLGQVRRGV